MWLEEKNGSNEKLKYKYHDGANGAENPFVIDLENYTLKRNEGFFEYSHVFSPKALIYECMNDPTITFKSDEIMLRTFETRLSRDNENKTFIYVDRKPSSAIIGNIIRFGSNSDDGANLATITGFDANDNKIYIKRHNKVNYNKPDKGQWLRCFSDYSKGFVIDNEYPKVYLEPTVWTINENEMGNMLNRLIDLDPTGLMGDLTIELDDEDNFGYGLRNVTYSYDGLNFTGGMTGAFDLEQEINFFGRSASVGPLHIDYSTIANSIMDEILRINTYKREAFRFYFNPRFLQNNTNWASTEFASPAKFPLTFRLYFDKDLELIGGNMRINLPGKGMPMPGGIVFIDNIGGGFTYPQTFNVAADFETYLPLWWADADLTLSLDQKYLFLDGRSQIFSKRLSKFNFDATVAWSYYSGKRFKGAEIRGETGIGSKSISLIAELTFKYKKYKSEGKTKTYIGGGGDARVEVFGITRNKIGVYFNKRRVKGTVDVPVIGEKSFYLQFSNITGSGNLSGNRSLHGDIYLYNEFSNYGVANFYDENGNQIILIPEAKRIPQNLYFASLDLDANSQLFGDISSGTTLNLPNNLSEAAITIDYEGALENVSVTLPDNTTKDVIVPDDTTVENSDYLYAMDYDIDNSIENGPRQMYIQINDAQAGDYVLSYTATSVLGTDIYEIIPVPEIVEDSLEASLNANNTVTLDWDLEENISGDVRYHLTMLEMDNGEVIDELPIYEDLIGEDEETVNENYITSSALTISGNNVSTTIKLNDNLSSGYYAFRVEPVLYLEGEENLSGKVSYSDEIVYIQNHSNFPTSPENLTVDAIGNGVTRVMWKENSNVDGWEIEVIDATGSAISTTTLLNSEIDPLKNLYNGNVYQNIGLESNVFADVLLQNIEYGEDYEFKVRAIKQTTQSSIVGHYDTLNNYIDLNSLEAELNEGNLIYMSQPDSKTGSFVEAEKINFTVEIYEEGKAEPVFSGNVFEGDTGEIGYEYNLDLDTDIESLRQISPGALVLRANVMDAVRLIPDNDIEKVGITILSPSGEELLNIPALSLTGLTNSPTNPLNISALANELSANYPDLTIETINQIKALYQSGAFTLVEGHLNIDFDAMATAGIEAFEPGRYTFNIEAYRANGDLTQSRFEVVIRDIVPSVFIENVTPNGSGTFNLVGYATGAQDVTLNGVLASVNDGAFSVDTAIDNSVVAYSLTDLFGNTYIGSLDYEEFDQPITYTVRFEENGGSSVDSVIGVAKNDPIEKPSNPFRSGYSFLAWYKNKELTEEWDFDEDLVTENIILFAKWKVDPSSTGAGGDVDKDDKLLEVNNEDPIPEDAKTSNTTITIKGDDLDVVFKGESFENLKDKDVKVTIKKLNKEDLNLSQEALDEIGDMPIYDISVFADGEKVDFKSDHPIEIKVKFKGESENHKYIAVYIDDAGNIEIMKDSFSDGETLIFTTNHLSHYSVMYIDKSFDDIKNHWAKVPIEALAARGVVRGTSDVTFNPQGNITRADFITLIVRYFDFRSANKDNFSDVNSDKYYAQPIAIAKGLGIVTGTGDNKYNPLNYISRQDMMVIYNRALKESGQYQKLEKIEKSLKDFTDKNNVSMYAVDSVDYMISTGIIKGANNLINPKASTTRAEVSQVLYNLLQK